MPLPPDNTRLTLNELLDSIAKEALESGDQAILRLVEETDELVNGVDKDVTHIIERLENLVAALDTAQDVILNAGLNVDLPEIETAYGIAGEILTMIDGR